MGIWARADYRWWLAGDTSGSLALSLKVFVVPLIAFALTRSTVQAGLIGTVVAAVSLLTSLLGGVIVDRHDRRALMRIHSAFGIAVSALVIGLQLSGRLTFEWLLGLVSVWALSGGLVGNAADAALRSIVSDTEYPQAVATNQGRDAAIGLVAAPIAAALYGADNWAPFGLSLLAYLLLGVSTWLIRSDLHPPAYQRGSAIGDMFSGVAWMRRRRRMRTLLLIAMLANLGMVGMMYSFELSLIANGMPPTQIGSLTAAVALAGILGSLLAGRVVQRFATGRVVAFAMAWVCASLLPALFWNSYWVMLASLAAESLVPPVLISALVGYLYGQTPIELQGRVQSITMLSTGALGALAPFAAGFLLAAVGYFLTIGTFFIFLLVPAAIASASPLIRQIPAPSEWKNCPL